MSDIYAAFEAILNPKGYTLSEQGKASLRFFVNKVAVEAGYLHPHDKESPGWHLTSQGREFLTALAEPAETTINVDTGAEQSSPSETARGDAFEQYFIRVLRILTTPGITKVVTNAASAAWTLSATDSVMRAVNQAASVFRSSFTARTTRLLNANGSSSLLVAFHVVSTRRFSLLQASSPANNAAKRRRRE